MELRKIAATAAAATAGVIATLATVAACGASSGTPQLDDLNNAPVKYPNYSVIYMAPDNFPNVTLECIQGAGFALTTRQNSAAAAQLVPEWDKFCAAQIGKQATQNGQP